MEPCDFTSCTLVGSTPPKVNGVGVISLCIGSYVDHLGERHALDMEIPNVYNVPESSFKILSTTHIKRYNMFLDTHFNPDVLIMLGLPSQVAGIWGDSHQTYGQDGYPAIYVTLGCNTPVMRTYSVDSGATLRSVASSVHQVRKPSERHNVDIAALKENKKGFDITPEFLVHLTFIHCGDSVMKLMGCHEEL